MPVTTHDKYLMPTRITSANIEPGSITADRLIEGAGGGPRITNIQVTGNDFVVIDDTAVSLSGGYIKITGAGFQNGCVAIIGTATATATTFNSINFVNAQVPALPAGTYIVYVVNPDGGVAIRVNGLTYSEIPFWITGSALPEIGVDDQISIQLSAAGDSPVAYSLQAGSTLPPGLSLSAQGLLSGAVTGLENDTVYSFTVIAQDTENQDSSRAFTLIVNVLIPLSNVQQITTRQTFYVSEPVLDGTSGRITFAGSKPQNWGHVFCGITTLPQSSFRSASSNSTINTVDTNHTLDGQGVIWYLDFDDYAGYPPDLVRAHNGYQYADYSASNPFAFGWSRSGSNVTVTAVNPSTDGVIYTRTATISSGTPRIILAGVAAEYGNYNVNVVSQTTPTLFYSPS